MSKKIARVTVGENEYKFTGAGVAILNMLKSGRSAAQIEMVNAAGLSSGAISGTLRRMRDGDVITRIGSEVGRGRPVYRLSDRARIVFEELEQVRDVEEIGEAHTIANGAWV